MFGMAHRSWFDSKLDYIDIGQSSQQPSNYASSTERNNVHRLSARPTGQEVEMTYILPPQTTTNGQVDVTNLYCEYLMLHFAPAKNCPRHYLSWGASLECCHGKSHQIFKSLAHTLKQASGI